MLAFEVCVNGERRYVAGHGDARLLTVWLNGRLPDEFILEHRIQMIGSVAVPGGAPGHFSTLTYPMQSLTVGDEITVRVVDVETPDQPQPQEGGQRVIAMPANKEDG